jgi:hypothetical protein
MEALRQGNAQHAAMMLSQAQRFYEQCGGMTEEQESLWEQVSERVAKALNAQNKRSGPCGSSSLHSTLRAALARSTCKGDAAVAAAVAALARHDFKIAHQQLQVAREAFESAGPVIKASRATMLSNLYSSVCAEEERIGIQNYEAAAKVISRRRKGSRDDASGNRFGGRPRNIADLPHADLEIEDETLAFRLRLRDDIDGFEA